MTLTPGLAIDVDETLSATSIHWMQELQVKFGNPEELTVHEMIRKYEFAELVPYWQTEEAFTLMNEWASSNDFQVTIPLIAEANVWLQKISDVIPIAAYVTMRPQSVVRGTEQWLQKHDFPTAPVIARPENIGWETAHEWKAATITSLYPTVQGLVDDRLAIVNAFSPQYCGTIFLYGQPESPRSDIDVVACPSWEDIYTSVLDKYRG